MPFAASLSRPDWRLSEGVRRRAAGLTAVAIVHLGLALLLLSLAPPTLKKKIVEMAMFTVNVPSETASEEPAPEAEQAPPPPAAEQPRPRPALPAQPQPAPPQTPPSQPAPEPAPSQPTPEPPRPPAPMGPPRPSYGPPDLRASSAMASRWADSRRVDGAGPNGEPLYAAAWVREPYDDELRGYLSTAQGPGWGMIACRTAPGNRVEACIIVGEGPEGSGIARAVQAAAWQFKVHPPRVGGRPQIGEWVRIRIDYGIRRNRYDQ